MLEPLHPGSPVLAEEQAAPRHLATTEQADGCMLIARCSDNGQRLDLFRLWPLRGVLETVEVSKVIAVGETSATAMDWVTIAPEQPLLCVGFSNGGTSFVSPRGAVCHSFLLAPKPIRRIRWHGPLGDARLLLLHDGGTLAAIDVGSLRCSIFGLVAEGSPEDALRFQLYELKGREDTVDVCMVDSVQPWDDVFATEGSPGVVALGTRPFLSLHRLLGTGASKGSLIGAAASALTSYAKSWIPFRGRGHTGLSAPSFASAGTLRANEIHMPPRGKVEELLMHAKFIDQARVGDVLAPAPPRRFATSLAATCDAFGRVGLFCLETFRVFHIWKGYRDAQVAWIHEVRQGSGVRAEDVHKLRLGGDEDATTGLVIYAPRRGLLEIWDVLEAPVPRRVDATAVDMHGHLLSVSGRVYLLRRSGRLDRIRWRRGASSAPPTDAGTLGDASANSEPDSDAFASPRSEGGPGLLDAATCAAGASPSAAAPSLEEEQMREEFEAFASLRALARRWTEDAAPAQHTLGEDAACGSVAFWHDRAVLASLKQLRSPKLIEQALALLLSVHLRHNEALVRSLEGCSGPDIAVGAPASGASRGEEALTPSENLLSALDWALEELAGPLQSAPQASLVRDRLAGEGRSLRLYTELLRAAICPIPPVAERAAESANGVWSSTELGKVLVAQQNYLTNPSPGSQASVSAGTDELLNFQVWLAQQVESLHGDAVTRGLAVKAHQLLCTYAPPGSDGAADGDTALSWTVLPYREFVAYPEPPPELLRFVCQALLISPQGQRQVKMAAELLQWRPIADNEQGYCQLPPIDAYGLDTVVARSSHGQDDEFSEACAECVLQWLCTVPLALLLQTPSAAVRGEAAQRFGAELVCCMRILFSQQPQVLLGAACFAPAPLLPRLCWMCHALAEPHGDGRAGAAAISVPVPPQTAWWLLAEQLRAWLRLACAASGGPAVSVHRLLFAWPAVLATHALEAAAEHRTAAALHQEHDRIWRQEPKPLSGSDEAAGIGCHPMAASQLIVGTQRPWVTAVALLEDSVAGTAAAVAPTTTCASAASEFQPPPRAAAEATAAATAAAAAGANGARPSGLQQTTPRFMPLPWAVAANCALFCLWRHLHSGPAHDHVVLQEGLAWIAVLPACLTQSALALLVFRCAFLGRCVAWLDAAATRPGDVDGEALDQAIELLRLALAPSADLSDSTFLGAAAADQQNDAAPYLLGQPGQPGAATSLGATLGPASPGDWSGDLGLRALARVGRRLQGLRQTLAEVGLLFRMLKAAVEAGLAWEFHALFPQAACWLAQEAQGLSFSFDGGLEAAAGDGEAGHRTRELRLELLLRLSTSGHSSPALDLAHDCCLVEDLHAVLLRHYLVRGRDDDLDAHIIPLRGTGAIVDLVLEAMWHRIAAALRLLCNDEEAQHAMVLCAISPEVLDNLVELDVDDSTADFVAADVAFALRSCSALASHPLLQEESPQFHEPAHLSMSLIRALSDNPLAPRV